MLSHIVPYSTFFYPQFMGLTIFSPIGVQILFFLEGIAHCLPLHADKHIVRPPAFKFVKNEKKKKIF